MYNNCQPDNSDRNVVAYNVIKHNTAESIEAKAGTNDGTMWKNTMDGSTITADDADSLIQIMGSGWVVAGSKGSNSPEDAIQIWNTDDGSYGFDNVVYDNAVAVGPPPGYVVHLPTSTTATSPAATTAGEPRACRTCPARTDPGAPSPTFGGGGVPTCARCVGGRGCLA